MLLHEPIFNATLMLPQLKIDIVWHGAQGDLKHNITLGNMLQVFESDSKTYNIVA